MGVYGSSGRRTETVYVDKIVEKIVEVPLPNPNPNNYKFIRVENIGKCLVVQLNYPDCTNFEGNKIMVYRDATLIQLINQKEIDPHFYEGSDKISPVARFVPTEEGWQLAIQMCEVLNGRK